MEEKSDCGENLPTEGSGISPELKKSLLDITSLLHTATQFQEQVKLQREIEQLTREYEAAKKENQQLRQEKKQILEEKQKIQNENQSLQFALCKAETQLQGLQQMGVTCQHLESENLKMHATIQELSNSNDKMKQRIDKLQVENQRLNDENQSLKTEIAELKTQLESQKTQLESQKTQLESLKTQLESQQCEIDRLYKKQDEANEENVKMKATLQQLTNLHKQTMDALIIRQTGLELEEKLLLQLDPAIKKPRNHQLVQVLSQLKNNAHGQQQITSVSKKLKLQPGGLDDLADIIKDMRKYGKGTAHLTEEVRKGTTVEDIEETIQRVCPLMYSPNQQADGRLGLLSVLQLLSQLCQKKHYPLNNI